MLYNSTPKVFVPIRYFINAFKGKMVFNLPFSLVMEIGANTGIFKSQYQLPKGKSKLIEVTYGYLGLGQKARLIIN